MNKLEFSIISEVGNIVKVENFIDYLAEFYHIDISIFGKVSLAIIEAVNNAILHGNEQDSSKYVRFSMEEVDGKLFVTIKDEGKGFNFNVIPDPTLPNTMEKNTGRGLFLMKTLSDELIFEDDGSKVTLVFNLNNTNE
jgi:serine/threonine-protein kinase RsbW